MLVLCDWLCVFSFFGDFAEPFFFSTFILNLISTVIRITSNLVFVGA
jgi:hypothetical protein